MRPSLLMFALLVGCGSPSRGSRTEELAVDSTWRLHSVRGTSLTIRLPPEFRKRNDYGCFDNVPPSGRILIPDIRDVCVSLSLSALKDTPSFPDGSDCNWDLAQRTDCVFYEEVHTESVRLGTRPSLIERRLRTGSIDHRRRVPEVLVRVALAPDSVAVLHFMVRGFEDVALATLVATTVQSGNNH